MDRPIRIARGISRWTAALACVASAGARAAPPAAKDPPARAAESFVLAEVQAGRIADLERAFPDPARRLLGGRFLEGLLDGSLAHVRVHRHGVRIAHAIIADRIDLENADVAPEVALTDCRFDGEVDLSHARFARGLSLDGSRFVRDATWNGTHVEGALSLAGATFDAGLSLRHARLDSTFVANAARFQGAVSFNTLRAAGVFLRGARFGGDANLIEASVDGNLEADEARFDGGVLFDSMKVRDSASFRKAVFGAGVSFNGVQVGEQFRFTEARFDGARGPVNFDSVRAHDVLLDKAAFAGPADFVNLETAKNFELRGASFSHASAEVNLRRIQVGGGAFLDSARFGGKLRLTDARLFTLDLSDSALPAGADLSLDGTSYTRITMGHGRRAWRNLIELAERAAFSPDVYGELEAFFRREGYADRADEAFLRGRLRAGREYATPERLLDRLYYGLSGYGRKPEWALIPGLVCILLGAAVFRARSMEPSRSDERARRYNPFAYSLDLFVPFIELDVEHAWKPRVDGSLAWYWVRVHRLLGRVLVPLALAGLTAGLTIR
jgi:hypothetical protein